MIISFKNKFVFVAVPKTAGHAIRTNLRPHLVDNDWEQCTRFEKKVFPIAQLAAKGHGHITALEIQPYLIAGQWDAFFSFAFVRHPFDRFVSFCSFYQSKPDTMRLDPLGAMKSMLADEALRSHVLMQPQHYFLCGEGGGILVDFIGKYEKLQNDFNEICGNIGVDSQILPRLNTSVRPAHEDILDTELKEKLASFYKKDFEYFGYSVTSNDVSLGR